MNPEIIQTSTSTRTRTHQFTVLLSATELAANAVLHGQVPGRGFRLTLTLDATRTLRIEVTDPRGDRLPRIPDPAGGYAESGRGLLLVAAYADRWGVDEGPAPCKTVWAELALLPGRGAT